MKKRTLGYITGGLIGLIGASGYYISKQPLLKQSAYDISKYELITTKDNFRHFPEEELKENKRENYRNSLVYSEKKSSNIKE